MVMNGSESTQHCADQVFPPRFPLLLKMAHRLVYRLRDPGRALTGTWKSCCTRILETKALGDGQRDGTALLGLDR